MDKKKNRKKNTIFPFCLEKSNHRRGAGKPLSPQKDRFTVLAFLLTFVALLLPSPPKVPGLYTLIIGAFTEEIVFRGAVQDFLGGNEHLKNKISLFPFRPSGANLQTSGLFALAHLFTHPPLWALGTFFPSLVLGEIWDRHGRLSLCIVLHLAYNLGYVWSPRVIDWPMLTSRIVV